MLSFDWRVLTLLNQESFQDMTAVKLIRVWTTFASSWYSLSPTANEGLPKRAPPFSQVVQEPPTYLLR